MAIDQARDDTPSMEGSAILMSRGIADKVVVITGTSSGLGEAAARHLAAQGATVVLGARRAEGAVHTEASAQNRLPWENALYSSEVTGTRNSPMDMPTSDFVHVGSLAELKAKGRLVVHGRHSPVLVLYDGGRVFALDNRCPHMGFPLDRGSVEDGILTCHWHHARFDLASGCTFDLWADDVPTCPVEVRDGEIWIKPSFAHGDPSHHWRQRLDDGLAHNLGLVIAKAVRGQLTAGVPTGEILRQAALFAVRNRDGWGVGATILTALGNLLPVLPEEETYLALFHGARRVAADCDGAAPRRERAPLASRPDLATLQRWLRHWSAVRHREAAERTLLTAITTGAPPAALAELAGRDRDGPRLRRRRTRARLHQQGLRMPRPDRLGARLGGAAERGRPDGGGARRRGDDRLAPSG